MYGIFQGVIEDRIGFFPAAFAHLVHAGDRVFRCNRTFIGCKEQGQMTLKEGQVLSLAITDAHLCSWPTEEASFSSNPTACSSEVRVCGDSLKA